MGEAEAVRRRHAIFFLDLAEEVAPKIEPNVNIADRRPWLERLEVEQKATHLAVEQRIRSALELAASSYSAIALTRDAAQAADRNYDLVSDAYGRGTASITALIDAQSAALSASEAAANAVHDFLLDLVRVERAMGTYSVLQPPEQRQTFLERLATLKERS